MKLLGFGTEWVDFDNSGNVELIVANGHVNRSSPADIGYRMRPQIYRQDAPGHWTEFPRDELGEYFSFDHLGRALVTLDVDRDGRVDIAVTHRDDSSALLLNRSPEAGNWISLELKSASGQRDAIGAIVSGNLSGNRVSSQLTAGDGYMCSNQRRIHWGLGKSPELTELRVSWPSGKVERFGSLAAGDEYLIVEGSGEAFPLSKKP
jgi:hypothetical protein